MVLLGGFFFCKWSLKEIFSLWSYWTCNLYKWRTLEFPTCCSRWSCETLAHKQPTQKTPLQKKLACKSSTQLHFPLFPVLKSLTTFFFQKLSVSWTFVSNLFNAIVTCQSISDSFAFRLTDVFLVNDCFEQWSLESPHTSWLCLPLSFMLLLRAM